MYEENNNNNNALLWVITVVNILILIILATFFAMSWDVINADGLSQEAGVKEVKQISNTQGKCGDGVCDTVEQNNIGVCPEDCD